jgi:hypothetical protein
MEALTEAEIVESLLAEAKVVLGAPGVKKLVKELKVRLLLELAASICMRVESSRCSSLARAGCLCLPACGVEPL